MFRTSNPALREDIFAPREGISALGGEATRPATMTAAGAATKTLILLSMCAGSAIFAWSLILPAAADGTIADPKVNPMLLAGGGLIGGLILALVTIFNPKVSPFTAPVYALVEGLFVGAISAFYATQFATTEDGVLTPNYGMILNAGMLTFGVLGVMLALYRSGIIKVTNRFAMMVSSATLGICVVYGLTILLGFFGVSIPYIHGSGMIGIGFSLFVIAIASLNLTLDFEFIARGEQASLPKYMEWYAGFGLLVTLIWLYIEILHLLAKLQSRD